MARKPSNPKNDATPKKNTRRKKTEEPVVETVANAIAEEPAVTASVEDASVKMARKPRAKKAEKITTDTPKKRGRKPKSEAVAAEATGIAAENAPAKKRGRKPKNETAADTVTETTVSTTEEATAKKRSRKPKDVSASNTEAPVKKRGRKKAVPEIVAEAAPPVEAETSFADSEPVEIKPDVVVNVADEPLPGQISFDGEVTVEPAPAEAASPAKKRRGRPAKTDAAPKRRGRPPKNTKPALVLTTTLQVGEEEFDISALAEKAYKDYKRVHKRKIVTDFHIYVKPEEGVAYFTVNGESAEDFKIDLK